VVLPGTGRRADCPEAVLERQLDKHRPLQWGHGSGPRLHKSAGMAMMIGQRLKRAQLKEVSPSCSSATAMPSTSLVLCIETLHSIDMLVGFIYTFNSPRVLLGSECIEIFHGIGLVVGYIYTFNGSDLPFVLKRVETSRGTVLHIVAATPSLATSTPSPASTSIVIEPPWRMREGSARLCSFPRPARLASGGRLSSGPDPVGSVGPWDRG